MQRRTSPRGSAIRPRGRWGLRQLVGVGLLVAGAITLGMAATAGAASSPDEGAQIGVTSPNGTVTPGPFDSGQKIDVTVPATTVFDGSIYGNNAETVHFVECSAPNGVVPTSSAQCDGNTNANDFPNSDGSMDFFNDTGGFYTVYALPDSVKLGEPGSSAVHCGNTPATECMLYIGDNVNDFTQPHVWSNAFFVNIDASDSGTNNPGNGTPPTAPTAPDPSLSTVTASPSTVAADGVNESTVTVTLLATGTIAVPNKSVTLTPSSGTAVVTGPSPAETDSSGQTTFTVTDTVGESVVLTAKDVTDNVNLNKTATVTFQAPAVSASQSSITANPTIVPSGSTTITVSLFDQGTIPQPVVGKTVSLSDGAGNAQIAPSSATTNSSGIASFTATDASNEQVTFTATDTTDSVTLSQTAKVTFGSVTVSATQSNLGVPQAVKVGTGTTATVTLLTATGTPVPGKAVSLVATSSPTSVSIGGPSSPTTDANGQVTFPVSDASVESVTLQATDTTDNIVLAAATVSFETPVPSSGNSTVTTSGTTSPADGETFTTVTVTMRDQFGGGLPGKTINVTGSPSGNVQIHPVNSDVTDSTGTVIFDVDDEAAETVTLTVTDTSDTPNVVLSQHPSITYQAGPPDPTGLGTTVTVSPANPPADGTTPSTVTVTIEDYFLNPSTGQTVSLQALNGSSKISPASGVTNAMGQVAFSVTDSTPEVVTYQATDVTFNNAVLAPEGVVTFGNPPALPPVVADCSVVANPSSVPADGTDASTVTVLLYDGNGDPVAGKTVTLTAAGGNSQITATNGTTNNSGMATFAVSDSTQEPVTYTAHDTSDHIDLTGLTATVTFTAATASTTTTTTTSGSSSGSTSSTSTTSTTAVGAAGSSSVALTGSSTGNTASTASTSGTATLASTGAPSVLPWLVGFGLLFLGAGTLGRRRFTRESSRVQLAERDGSSEL